MKNACYLSYLTFNTTSYQSQEPNDKLVRMHDPASAKHIAHVALRTNLSMSKHPFCLPGILPFLLSLPTIAIVKLLFS